MSSVKGTPSYWKKSKINVLATIKQSSVPFFLTSLYADIGGRNLLKQFTN